jgi:hypothetical protein
MPDEHRVARPVEGALANSLNSDCTDRVIAETHLYSCLISRPRTSRPLCSTASLSDDRLKSFLLGRESLPSRISALKQINHDYWTSELPSHRGETISFNQKCCETRPELTVAIVTLANRFDHILRRLEDVKEFHSIEKNIEVIVVLADRERYAADNLRRLYAALKFSGVPAKLVTSLHNNISTNRNLATLESRTPDHGTILFIDDDVHISLDTFKQLYDVWQSTPQLGVLTAPSVTSSLRPHKPNSTYLKASLTPDVLALDRYGGMVGITSIQVARGVPFCPGFEIADDNIFGMQLHNLGLFIGCLKSPQQAIRHEEAPINASLAQHNFWKYLAYGATLKYLEPDGFVRFNHRIARPRIYDMITDTSIDEYLKAWDAVCVSGSDFLERGNCESFCMNDDGPSSVARHLVRAHDYITSKRQWLERFREKSYRSLKLSAISEAAYCGPFDPAK